jgi:acyl-CoA thioesterase-1
MEKKRWLNLFMISLVPILAVAATPKKIVLVGDSLTEGYGVTREQAYPALVQKMADQDGKSWKIINAGISGSTSSSAASRVKWALKDKPDLLVLALGANDGLRGVPVKTMEENLNKALSLCKQAKVKALLVGMRLPPNYGADYVKSFAAVFPRVAKKQGVAFMPFLLERVAGRPELNQMDQIHPNEKGHALIAEQMYSVIQKAL